jgi:hypothetical protein
MLVWVSMHVDNQDASCMLRYFLSGFQLGYNLGLGGCWPAGYYLIYSRIIIYIPMYGTCLPSYLCAFFPIMNNSLLYWLLNYLCRSGCLLTYLLTYVHTYVTTYIRTYLHTYVPSYLCTCIIYIHSLVLSTYLCIVPAYLHTNVPTYLLYDSSLYIYRHIIYAGVAIYARTY